MGTQFIQLTVVLLFSLEMITGCGGNSTNVKNLAIPQNTINSTANVNNTVASNVYHPQLSTQQPVTVQSSYGDTQDGAAKTTSADNSILVDSRDVPEIFSVPEGEVALTIDDGPSPYTEQIISILNKYHAKATFFFIGNNALQYPNAVRMAAANGDEIGDHTMDHQQLTKLTQNMQDEEISVGAKDIGNYDPAPILLFRPPYEAMNKITLSILAKNHMDLALWNRDPRDWAAKTPKQIVQAVLGDSPSGGVFDLHDKLLTMEALPDILQGLEAMHLQVVVLPEPVR